MLSKYSTIKCNTYADYIKINITITSKSCNSRMFRHNIYDIYMIIIGLILIISVLMSPKR